MNPANVGVPVKAGEAEKTSAPVPVSSVTAVIRFAEEGVPRKVAIPLPRPDTSLAIATELHVAAPSAESDRTNWFEQEVPPYASTEPVPLVVSKALATEETAK